MSKDRGPESAQKRHAGLSAASFGAHPVIRGFRWFRSFLTPPPADFYHGFAAVQLIGHFNKPVRSGTIFYNPMRILPIHATA